MKEFISDIPFEVIPIKELEQALAKKKVKNFVDPDFPPSYDSLYDGMKIATYPFTNAVHWKRPSEFLPKGDIKIILDGIEPNDIRGGELKNSYFISALKLISENT